MKTVKTDVAASRPKIPKIVVIGGGTGSYTLLKELKHQPCDITAIVNMVDDGGSTGLLRSELGVLPPGDIRQCLVALSEAPELRKLFNYRFPSGSLAGHSLGNLFISAAEKMTNNFDEALQLASDVLQVRGSVVPVTLTNCTLVLGRSNDKGSVDVHGEYAVAQTDFQRGDGHRLRLEPDAKLNPNAAQAIKEADLLVVSPGSLYRSIAPTLMVSGMSEALRATRAKTVFICNLVNTSNHTAGFSVTDYADEFNFFTGRNVDYILYNDKKPTKEQLRANAAKGDEPVIVDTAALKAAPYVAIGGDFLSSDILPVLPGDLIERSVIRHDAEALVAAIMALL